MHRNRTIYIALVIAFLVFSIAYQSRISAVLLIASLCYPVLAVICVVISSRLISAGFIDNAADDQERKGSSIQLSPRIVRQKGEVSDLWIYVRSRSVMPYAPVELLCNIPDRDTGFFSAKRIYASVPPLGRCRISVPVMHRYRGAYVAEISRASFYDPLRIIRITRRMSSEATLVYLPRKLDFGELIADAASEDSSSPVSLLKGEKEDFSHVREYIEGDIMQLVHWKLTAKQDELMIKQYDETTDRRVMILCDYHFDNAGSTAMKQADAVIEAAVAVAMSVVKAGVDAQVDFGEVSGEYCSEIKDMADFERFYDLSAIIPSRIETVDFCRLITESCREAQTSGGCSVMFLITGRLTEEVIATADAAAGFFRGLLVLANVCPGADPELEEKAAERRFDYLPIRESSVV